MGLLGKFFKGGGREESSGASEGRSKRGRAQSIRSAPPPVTGEAGPAAQDLPLINLDDVDKPASGAPALKVEEPARNAPKATKPVSPEAPPAPPPSPAPAPKAKPQAPRAAASPAPASGGRSTSRAQSRQKPLGELLIEAGSVSTEQLSRALRIQEKGGKGLAGQILVSMGACPQAALLAALNRQFRITTVEIDRVIVATEATGLVPEAKCREHRLMPFEKMSNVLCVAMANCLNRKAINEIEELTKLKVKPFNSTWIEIRKALDNLAATGSAQTAAPVSPPPPGQASETPPEIAEAAPPPAPPVPEPTAQPEPVRAEASEEAPPFVGRPTARIEGLDELDPTKAEVVEETSRGLASRHQVEIQRRRNERQKQLGQGKGLVGKLVAPGLDAYRPEGAEPEAPAENTADRDRRALVPLSLVDEKLLAGAKLPVARQLAASRKDFEAAAAPAPAPTPAVETAEKPQEEALPAVKPIEFKPEEPKELTAVALSDQEWAALQEDLEPDPVALWENTYASVGPVPAAQSWL
jgi:hypothetical protein